MMNKLKRNILLLGMVAVLAPSGASAFNMPSFNIPSFGSMPSFGMSSLKATLLASKATSLTKGLWSMVVGSCKPESVVNILNNSKVLLPTIPVALFAMHARNVNNKINRLAKEKSGFKFSDLDLTTSLNVSRDHYYFDFSGAGIETVSSKLNRSLNPTSLRGIDLSNNSLEEFDVNLLFERPNLKSDDYLTPKLKWIDVSGNKELSSEGLKHLQRLNDDLKQRNRNVTIYVGGTQVDQGAFNNLDNLTLNWEEHPKHSKSFLQKLLLR